MSNSLCNGNHSLPKSAPQTDTAITSGDYFRVVNALFDCGFKPEFVEKCNITNSWVESPDGSVLARHSYIPEIYKVGFFFISDNSEYANVGLLTKRFSTPRGYSPNFRVGVTVTGVPCFAAIGEDAISELFYFITQKLMNDVEGSVGHNLTSISGAVFSVGRNKPKNGNIVIEFRHPEYSEAFVDYINNHFYY